MNKTLQIIISSFQRKDFFTIADARKIPSLSFLSTSGVFNLLNKELSQSNSKIGKISYGVYCVRKEIPGTGIFYSTTGVEYLRSKYIGTGKRVRGYVAGLSFLNEIGYSDDVPGRIEIVSNVETTRGRELRIGPEKAYVRKAPIRVTAKNARILPVFDILAKKTPKKDVRLMNALTHYLSEAGIDKNAVELAFKNLPKNLYNKINIGGLLDGTLEGK